MDDIADGFIYKFRRFSQVQENIYSSLSYFVLYFRGVGTEGWINGVHISAKMAITGAELLGHTIFSLFLTLN